MVENERLYLDREEGLARIRGNERVYKTVLRSFAGKDLLGEMQERLASGDALQASHTVHAIKGTAGNLSMPALYKAAASLEQALKDGTHTNAQVEEFTEIYEATQEVVEKTLDEM